MASEGMSCACLVMQQEQGETLFISENRQYLPRLLCELRLSSRGGCEDASGARDSWEVGWQRGLWTRGAADLKGLEGRAAGGR